MGYDLKYVSDYLEIRTLSARYNRFADAGDGESYAKLYTEDGEFHPGDRICRGRKEIGAAAGANKNTIHITTDPIIEINGDEARQTSRNLNFYRALDGSENYFVATGMYIDVLVRTSEGWRFKIRKVELDLNLKDVLRGLKITDEWETQVAKKGA
jgi:hypothetical protein